MWEDVYASGIRPALAELLPGVQGKVQAGGDDHEDMQGVWASVYISVECQILAALLPGVPGEQEK